MPYSAISVLTEGKKKSSAFLGFQEKEGENNLHDFWSLNIRAFYWQFSRAVSSTTLHISHVLHCTPGTPALLAQGPGMDPLLPWQPQAQSTARDHGTTHYKHQT